MLTAGSDENRNNRCYNLICMISRRRRRRRPLIWPRHWFRHSFFCQRINKVLKRLKVFICLHCLLCCFFFPYSTQCTVKRLHLSCAADCEPYHRHAEEVSRRLKKKKKRKNPAWTKCFLVAELADKANRCLHLEPLCGTIDLSPSLMWDLSHLTDFSRLFLLHIQRLSSGLKSTTSSKAKATAPASFYPLRLPVQYLDKRLRKWLMS